MTHPAPSVRSVLLPGRHHVLTRFQADYLRALVAGEVADTDGVPVRCAEDVAVVWAVISANHRGTRRNPVSFHRREAAIERFSLAEGLTGGGLLDPGGPVMYRALGYRVVPVEAGDATDPARP